MEDMKCVECRHTDLRDMGVTRGQHVYICRRCNTPMYLIAKLRRVSDPKVIASLVL